MRRLAFIAVLAAALGLTVPAALAKTHRSSRSHARHHARTHHKALRARTLKLTPASVNKTSGSNGSGDSSSSTGTTSTPAPDFIGVVGNFTNSMLTINLNDNSTVTGLVDKSTEFECVAPPASAGTQTASPRDHGGDSGSGDGAGDGGGTSSSSGSDSSSGSGDQPSTTPTTPPQPGDDGAESGEDNGQADNETGDDNGQDQAQAGCDQTLLVSNAQVKEAELRITPSGKTFEKIVLFH